MLKSRMLWAPKLLRMVIVIGCALFLLPATSFGVAFSPFDGIVGDYTVTYNKPTGPGIPSTLTAGWPAYRDSVFIDWEGDASAGSLGVELDLAKSQWEGKLQNTVQDVWLYQSGTLTLTQEVEIDFTPVGAPLSQLALDFLALENFGVDQSLHIDTLGWTGTGAHAQLKSNWTIAEGTVGDDDSWEDRYSGQIQFNLDPEVQLGGGGGSGTGSWDVMVQINYKAEDGDDWETLFGENYKMYFNFDEIIDGVYYVYDIEESLLSWIPDDFLPPALGSDLKMTHELSLWGEVDSNSTLYLNAMNTGVVNVTDVPEPGTLLLIGTGIFGFIGYRLRRRKKLTV